MDKLGKRVHPITLFHHLQNLLASSIASSCFFVSCMIWFEKSDDALWHMMACERVDDAQYGEDREDYHDDLCSRLLGR